MKRVYRSFSDTAAHQWVEENKKTHEEHLLDTGNSASIFRRLDGVFNTMGVAVQRD